MLPTTQIIFEGVKQSDAIEGYIHHEMDSLRDLDAPITESTITLCPPRANHFSGDPYRVRARLTIEGGHDIIVNHDPGAGRRHDAMEIAVRDTFRIVRRRLEHALRKHESVTVEAA
jgi:hypothetical protein